MAVWVGKAVVSDTWSQIKCTAAEVKMHSLPLASAFTAVAFGVVSLVV